MVNDIVCWVVWFWASFTKITKLFVTEASVTVPEIKPFAERVNPVGSVPEYKLYVNALSPIADNCTFTLKVTEV